MCVQACVVCACACLYLCVASCNMYILCAKLTITCPAETCISPGTLHCHWLCLAPIPEHFYSRTCSTQRSSPQVSGLNILHPFLSHVSLVGLKHPMQLRMTLNCWKRPEPLAFRQAPCQLGHSHSSRPSPIILFKIFRLPPNIAVASQRTEGMGRTRNVILFFLSIKLLGTTNMVFIGTVFPSPREFRVLSSV